MPYGYRRRYGRRRRYKRKGSRSVGFLDRKYSTKDIAMSAWKSAKWLASMVNVEKKVYTVDFVNTVGTSGSIQTLNNMAVGDTQNLRDGNSIKSKSVAITGNVRFSGGATDTMVRMVLLWDNQQVADNAPSLTDIFGSVTPSQYAQLNIETLGRFSIIADKRIIMTATNQAASNKTFKFVVKLNRHVRFNGTASSDIQKNGLYLVVFSNEATNTPTVSYSSQYRYVDN